MVNNNSVAQWTCEWIWGWSSVGCALRYVSNSSCTDKDAQHCRGAYGTNTACTSENHEYNCKAVWYKMVYENYVGQFQQTPIGSPVPKPCTLNYNGYDDPSCISCCDWNDNRKCYLNMTEIALSYCSSLSPG